MRQKNFTRRHWVKLGLVLGLMGLLAGPYYLGVTPKSSSLDSQKIRVSHSYGKLPLYFIENKGQVDNRLKFYEKAGGHAIYFTQESIYFALRKKEKAVKARHMEMASPGTSPGAQEKAASPAVVQLTPLGMRKGLTIEAVGPQEAKFNYFIGNDPAKWRTNIPSYRAVVYREAYPGIDLKFYGTGRQLEYDIIVKPGADPNQVKFQYAGIKGLEITRGGDLAIHLPDGGQLIQKKPIVYQEIAGQRVAREGKFRITKHTAQCVYGFEVAYYDKKYPLVIDPVLSYSTYLGGSNKDEGNGIAVDNFGNAYVTGVTDSLVLPVPPPIPPLPAVEGSIQPNPAGLLDAFVLKLNAEGSALVYGTYLGSSGNDEGRGIAVDTAGCAYVIGTAGYFDFPTENPYQANFRPTFDAFVAKLNPSGSALVYSTYLGGIGSDGGRDIDVDSSGDAYVIGYTASADFPRVNPIQSELAGLSDAFVAKLSFDSNTSELELVYSTYLGGTGRENTIFSPPSGSIAVDFSGKAYVTGTTTSTDFPTVGNLQPHFGGGFCDAFVAGLSFENSILQLVYSAYLGGIDLDRGYGIDIDNSGNAYLTGETRSDDFPKVNPLQPTRAGPDAYVAKLNASGSAFVYATYLGGFYNETGLDIAVDASGRACIVGRTASFDFPTENPIQDANGGGTDAFVAKLDDSGLSLEYATYFGGAGGDHGHGIVVDASGNTYVTGLTSSTDLPIVNPLQATFAGGLSDVFVAKLFISPSPQAQIQDLITEVEALVTAGVLNKGQGNSLTRKLVDALDHLGKGNPHAAIQKLQEFISVVTGYIRTGKLSPEQGQLLIDAANHVITQLSG